MGNPFAPAIFNIRPRLAWRRLLLMRLVGGIGLLDRGITGLWGGPPLGRTMLEVLLAVAGILLCAGLWTPIAGALVALVELWNCFSGAGDAWPHILLATLGAALAMLGPGAWSADARLFWMEAHRHSRS